MYFRGIRFSKMAWGGCFDGDVSMSGQEVSFKTEAGGFLGEVVK